MKEHVEKRLAELRAERERGERVLAETRDTLLRISGAIQVLEEVLHTEPERTATVCEGVEARPDGGLVAKVEEVSREMGARMSKATQEQTDREAVLLQMRSLSDTDRAHIISSFCRCGSANPKCQCWNDE